MDYQWYILLGFINFTEIQNFCRIFRQRFELINIEPCHEKTCFWSFQTCVFCCRDKLESRNLKLSMYKCFTIQEENSKTAVRPDCPYTGFLMTWLTMHFVFRSFFTKGGSRINQRGDVRHFFSDPTTPKTLQ